MNTRLPIGTRVRILKHRPGWTARVSHHSAPTSFYIVRLLSDDAGQEVEEIRHDGPYCRSELEPIADPQPGHPGPAMPSDKDVHFSTTGRF